MYGVSDERSRRPPRPSSTRAQVAELIAAGAELIDVRRTTSGEGGRIAGAAQRRGRTSSPRRPSSIAARPAGALLLPHAATAPAMAAEAFREAGYDAYNLAGGIEAWAEAGRSSPRTARSRPLPASRSAIVQGGQAPASRLGRRRPVSREPRRTAPPRRRAARAPPEAPRSQSGSTAARLDRPGRPQARRPHLRRRRRARARARGRRSSASCSRSSAKDESATKDEVASPARPGRGGPAGGRRGRRGGRRHADRPARRARGPRDHDRRRPADDSSSELSVVQDDIDDLRTRSRTRPVGRRLRPAADAPAPSRASARPWSGAGSSPGRARRRPRRAAPRAGRASRGSR